MNETTKRTAKAESTVKSVKKSKTVSTPNSTPKTYDAASDAELTEQLLSGSNPSANVANGGAGGRMTIDELLHTYFAPTDLVTVKNPFGFNTGWVYSDPKDIKIEQPSPETRRVYGIGREFAKTRILHSGESVVLQGWEAYVGLTRFFKQWAQTTYGAGDMNNPARFREFMGKAYGGIYDPNANNNVVDSGESARQALENDLGLTDGGDA